MANYRTCNNTLSVLMNYVKLTRDFLKWQLTLISNKAYNLYNIYWCKHMKVSCSSVEPIFLPFMLFGSAAGHFIIWKDKSSFSWKPATSPRYGIEIHDKGNTVYISEQLFAV